MKKIVIFSYMGIGDNFMFLRSLSAYNLKNVELVWVVKSEFQGIIDNCFDDNVHFNFKQAKAISSVLTNILELVKFLKLVKPSGIIFLDYKTKPVSYFNMVCKLAGIKNIAATVENKIIAAFIRKYFLIKNYKHKHEVLRYTNLLDIYLEKAVISENHFFIVDTNIEKINTLEKFIVIVPGSARQFKQWDIDKYIRLISELISKGLTIIILGGKEDLPIGQEIERQVCCSDLYNFIGKTTLQESAGIIKK